MYIGSYQIDDLLTFYAQTQSFSTGNATDADSVPAYRIYEDETGTPILTGNMALLDSGNTDGFYSEQITLSAANGFEFGKSYCIRILGTVSSVASATLRQFQIGAKVSATYWLGTILATPATAGIPDVNTKNINNVAAATPGASGGILISGSNSGTTTLGALTVSGAVAFQSTFAVTTSTSLGALSCTTLTASGAVALQSTVTVTGTTTFAAVALSTLTSSGTVTLNAFTVSNAFTISGATTLTGAVTATNAGNDIRGVVATVSGTVTLAAAQAFDNTGTWTGNVVGSVGSIGLGGISAASFNANAIDATALAASAVTEIQSGLATSANQTTLLANDVKLLAAVYDSATIAGNVLTLSNGAQQTVTAAGRVTV